MSTSILSVLLLLSLFSFQAESSCRDDCVVTLDSAQDCLRECINLAPNTNWGGFQDYSSNGASRLWQCLDGQKTKHFDDDKLVDLIKCCNMNASCSQTMLDARTCANSTDGSGGPSCIPPCIKRTARQYLGCIQTKARADVCKFAGFGCVGQLVGDKSYDFLDVLQAGAEQVTRTDCSPLEDFVNGICGVSQRCCSQCNARMGVLASCLVNQFVLPLNFNAQGTTCEVLSEGNEQCSLGDAVTAIGRSSANMDGDDSDVTYDLQGVNVDDCSDDLTMNFVVHNESYAVDQFMECIGKKMGEIIALEDEQGAQGENAGGRSANVVVAGTLSLVASTMLVAAVMAI